jgi:hypothetical protein
MGCQTKAVSDQASKKLSCQEEEEAFVLFTRPSRYGPVNSCRLLRSPFASEVPVGPRCITLKRGNLVTNIMIEYAVALFCCRGKHCARMETSRKRYCGPVWTHDGQI